MTRACLSCYTAKSAREMFAQALGTAFASLHRSADISRARRQGRKQSSATYIASQVSIVSSLRCTAATWHVHKLHRCVMASMPNLLATASSVLDARLLSVVNRSYKDVQNEVSVHSSLVAVMATLKGTYQSQSTSHSKLCSTRTASCI
jgi:hypothetical protein